MKIINEIKTYTSFPFTCDFCCYFRHTSASSSYPDQRKTKTKKKTRDHRKEAPNNDVAIDESHNNFLVTNPPGSTQEDIDKWNRIVNLMQGVEGFDPIGYILAPACRKKNKGFTGY